jgi:dihydroorotate dehydrogenase
MEPETAHAFAERGMKSVERVPYLNKLWRNSHTVPNRRLQQTIFGETFQNPVGLGAGFDKNGKMVNEIQSLGFGFTEIGTVTPKPQEGNQKPRLHRHIKEETLQNAMGFNNFGSEDIFNNLKKDYPFSYPVGVNIGKNKTTSEDEAIADYLYLVEKFHYIASYLVVNISSPNTPNLRDLQNIDFIKELFFRAKKITDKPILLKIAPDMTPEMAVELSYFAVESGASGIIATNTTVDYSLIKSPAEFGGGLSGKVLKEKSFRIFEEIAKELYGKTVLISVGGIDSPDEVYRRLKAGASLVQIYTSLIYKGPNLIRDINFGLLKLMKKEGFSTIDEVIGHDRLRK